MPRLSRKSIERYWVVFSKRHDFQLRPSGVSEKTCVHKMTRVVHRCETIPGLREKMPWEVSTVSTANGEECLKQSRKRQPRPHPAPERNSPSHRVANLINERKYVRTSRVRIAICVFSARPRNPWSSYTYSSPPMDPHRYSEVMV